MLRKVFIALDTTKDGFLSPVQLKNGMLGIEESFKKILGKNDEFEPDWKQVISAIDVTSENDSFGFDAFVTAASDR